MQNNIMADEAQQVSTSQEGSSDSSTNRPTSSVYRAVKGFFWMDEQMAKAAREGFGPGQAGWEEFALARAAANDAATLGETGEGLGSAVLLVRSAIALLVRAHLRRQGIEVSPTASAIDCWKQFLELPSSEAISLDLSPNQRTLFTAIMATQGEEYLAQQSEEHRKFAVRTMLELAQKLAEPFELGVNRVPRVQVGRWARISGAAVILLLILGYTWQKVTYRPNVALHKHVTIETAQPTWTKDPNQLVDGNRTEMAFHTIEGPNQNATIDLGAPYRISRVVVYNRMECCQERAVPLRIDVSEDGKQFKKVAQRDEVFMEDWKANFSPVKARYVRLTDLSTTYFHLSEVEVY